MEALDLTDALVDQEVAILVPHVPAVVELCLRLAANSELGEPLRCKALHCVDSMTRLKKKVITLVTGRRKWKCVTRNGNSNMIRT